MAIFNIDLKKTNGKIKPMHAVNNGPTGGRAGGNIELFKSLEIPYARYHDASFWSGYGGEFSVDVHRIFRNFDADENDPANYIFEPTDKYIENTYAVGTKPYYRLGASIEHGYKYGTYPPKDFHKWARICENIIRHYTEGWGNGFNYDIEYWEIWNEPDCTHTDGLNNPCWQGKMALFIEFYEVAAKHLKSKFPHLKIGGPAFTSSWHYEFINPFLKAVKEKNIPMDFYSFHGYMWSPTVVKELYDCAMKTFEEFGLEKVEFHLNEWNYMRSWEDSYLYSVKQMGKAKGASFVLGSMCVGQSCGIDMMMYYDARPCAFNGIFAPYVYTPLKPFYAFGFFRDIFKLENSVEINAINENVFAVASTNGEESAIALTYFTPEDTSENTNVTLNIQNIKEGATVQYYLLDEENDATLIKEEKATENYSVTLDMKLFDSYLIKIKEA